MVRISGRGYGHGVGLCQEGAMAMANRGWKYDKIINFYFKGVRIVDINEIGPTEQELKNDIENKDTLIAK
jgi:stage II sporulation protein D